MIAGIETATAACSVAVAADDGHLLAEATSLAGPSHTQRLLADLQHALAMAGAGPADVSTVVVGLGPGTFTGLRIGIATARALAQALGARLVGVPTLASLALALAEGDAAAKSPVVVPLIDGKRGEVFAACYRRAAGYAVHCATDAAAPPLELVRGPVAVPAAELQSFLAPWPTAIVGGEGATLYAGELPSRAHVSRRVNAPTAAMAVRAWVACVPGLVDGADDVLPIYVRAPDAERWGARGTGRAGRGPAR
jgi:tRNA threonylcarbamoyladenosine biosynthesis protein TsaB